MGTIERYNGWTNRETWAVALWINNDQGMQEQLHEQLAEAITLQTDEDLTAGKAGEIVREYVDGLFDFESFYGETMPTDSMLLTMRDDIGSLYRVDWYELGASFLQDVQEQQQ